MILVQNGYKQWFSRVSWSTAGQIILNDLSHPMIEGVLVDSHTLEIDNSQSKTDVILDFLCDDTIRVLPLTILNLQLSGETMCIAAKTGADSVTITYRVGVKNNIDRGR